MRLGSLVGSLALAACSTPESTPDAAVPVPPGIDEYYRAQCERAIACEPEEAGHARWLQEWYCSRVGEAHDAREIAGGHARLDEASLDACLSALRESGCRGPDPEICFDVVQGTHDVGEPCVTDGQCVPGARCALGLECPHVCERYVATGQPCDETTWCEDHCVIPRARTIGECRPWYDPIGDPCDDEDDCSFFYAECVGGRCALFTTAIGDPCEFFGWWVCQPGQTCDLETGLCRALPGDGEPCATMGFEACEHGLTCIGGRCAPPRSEGEECRDDDDCNPTSPYCVDDACRADPTGNECDAYPGCPESFACVPLVSMSCRRRVAEGELCLSDAHCQAGMRCLDGSCARIALPGGACASELECPSSFRCVDGACAARARTGEPCSVADDCVGMRCIGGTCAYRATDESCAHCASGVCDGDACAPIEVVPVGADCEGPTLECEGGSVCDMADPDFDSYRCFPLCAG